MPALSSGTPARIKALVPTLAASLQSIAGFMVILLPCFQFLKSHGFFHLCRAITHGRLASVMSALGNGPSVGCSIGCDGSVIWTSIHLIKEARIQCREQQGPR